MPEQQKYASFATEDLRDTSALFDDVDARIKAFTFTMTAPPNYTLEAGGKPIFAVLTFLIDGTAPEQERTVTQSYSLGGRSGEEFAISDDGYGLIPLEDINTPRRGTKFTTLTDSFQTVGIASTLLKNGDFSKLLDLYGHFKRVTDPVRNFRDQDQLSKRKKSTFPAQTLILTKILAMPGEAAGTAAPAKKSKANGKAGQPTAAPVAAAPPADEETAVVETGDLDFDTMEWLLAALRSSTNPHRTADGKRTLQRGQVTMAINTIAGRTNPKRGLYAKRAFNEDYLVGLGEQGVIEFQRTVTGQPIVLVE